MTLLTKFISWTHTDKSYCDYALSFCVARSLGHNLPQRNNFKYVPPTGTLEGGGANFVDASLKVVVKQAAGTLMVFKPNYYHGTTLPVGALNHAITYAFSKRVADASRKMRIEVEEGAGDGNLYAEIK